MCHQASPAGPSSWSMSLTHYKSMLSTQALQKGKVRSSWNIRLPDGLQPITWCIPGLSGSFTNHEVLHGVSHVASKILKSLTPFSWEPSLERIGRWSASSFTVMYTVFLALRKRPTLAEAFSAEVRRSWASFSVFQICSQPIRLSFNSYQEKHVKTLKCPPPEHPSSVLLGRDSQLWDTCACHN